jgi:hypothetical protein
VLQIFFSRPCRDLPAFIRTRHWNVVARRLATPFGVPGYFHSPLTRLGAPWSDTSITLIAEGVSGTNGTVIDTRAMIMLHVFMRRSGGEAVADVF